MNMTEKLEIVRDYIKRTDVNTAPDAVTKPIKALALAMGITEAAAEEAVAQIAIADGKASAYPATNGEIPALTTDRVIKA